MNDTTYKAWNASAGCKAVPKGFRLDKIRRKAPDGHTREAIEAREIMSSRHPGHDVQVLGATAVYYVMAVSKEPTT